MKKVSCEDDVYPVCNTSDPSHPTGVEPMTSFWFLVRAPVVQKVDSTMHGINLCPMDNGIVPANTYPLDIFIWWAVHLLNNWGQMLYGVSYRRILAASFTGHTFYVLLSPLASSPFGGFMKRRCARGTRGLSRLPLLPRIGELAHRLHTSRSGMRVWLL